jgi:hypothetical protein
MDDGPTANEIADALKTHFCADDNSKLRPFTNCLPLLKSLSQCCNQYENNTAHMDNEILARSDAGTLSSQTGVLALIQHCINDDLWYTRSDEWWVHKGVLVAPVVWVFRLDLDTMTTTKGRADTLILLHSSVVSWGMRSHANDIRIQSPQRSGLISTN